MRILIVAPQMAGDGISPWLLDDLAIALADAGDEVDVLIHDTKHGRPLGRNQYGDRRIRVYSMGPTRPRGGRLGKLVNYVVTGWKLHTLGYGSVRRRRYDLGIYTSIAAFSWGLPNRLRRAGVVRRSVFVLWDFFPIHQYEIGRMRRRLFEPLLRRIERLAISGADTIAVMSPANETFLRRYHPDLPGSTMVVPPWTGNAAVAPIKSAREGSEFSAIFGGQLGPGRGLDTLLDAASIVQTRCEAVRFVIAGGGPARSALLDRSLALKLRNTEFLEPMPRDRYRALLSTSDVGLAITVPGVSVPTFPSKIVEYCAVGLPVIVCVEAASDAGSLIEESGAGLAVRAGDPVALAEAVVRLYEERQRGELGVRAVKARALFEEQLSATVAARRIRSLVPDWLAWV